MEKRYNANEELEKILLERGFIKINRNSSGSKKVFKSPEQPNKEIYFDQMSIILKYYSSSTDLTTKITKEKLKYLLLFFKLKGDEFKEVFDSGRFFENKIKKNLDRITSELKYNKQFNGNKSEREKLQKILNAFSEIENELGK